VFLEGIAGQVLQEYNLDWNTGQHRLTRQWYPAPSGSAGTQNVRWRNTQPYFFDDGNIVFTIENDRIRVCNILGHQLQDFAYVQTDGSLVTKKLTDLPEDSKDPYVLWDWRDLNGDGMPQQNEYTFYKRSEAQPYWTFTFPTDFKLEEQWSLTVKSKYKPGTQMVTIPCDGFDSKGNPIYSWWHAKLLADIPNTAAYVSDLTGGKPRGEVVAMGFSFDPASKTMYYLLLDRSPTSYPYDVKFRALRTTDGKRLFSFGSVTPFGVKGRGWQAPEMMLPAQMPMPPGDFLFIGDAGSAVHVYTRDSLYAGTLLAPYLLTPEAKAQDPNFLYSNVAGEMWWSHVWRNAVDQQVYLAANGNGEPMSRLYRVNGLDQVRFFGGEMNAGSDAVHLSPMPMP
jgi:hypothetical protein